MSPERCILKMIFLDVPNVEMRISKVYTAAANFWKRQVHVSLLHYLSNSLRCINRISLVPDCILHRPSIVVNRLYCTQTLIKHFTEKTVRSLSLAVQAKTLK